MICNLGFVVNRYLLFHSVLHAGHGIGATKGVPLFFIDVVTVGYLHAVFRLTECYLDATQENLSLRYWHSKVALTHASSGTPLSSACCTSTAY